MNAFNVPDELLQRVVTQAKEVGHEAATSPVVVEMVRAAFGASLLSNENVPCRFRLALVDPEQASVMIRLEQEVALDPAHIRRLAAGAGEQAAIGVWDTGAGLQIWGIAHRLSFAQAFVDAVGAGRLKVGCWASPSVVIEPGDCVAINTSLLGHTHLLTEMLKPDHPQFPRRHVVASTLRSIIRRVVLLGHGGTIVVLGRGSSEWEKFCGNWGAKSSTASSQLINLLDEQLTMKPDPVGQNVARDAVTSNALRVNIEQFEQAYADLTMMDGAVVLDSDLRLVGAGAKISAKDEFELDCVWLTEPAQTKRCSLSDLGGTRHQSAARLVKADKHCTAFVVSSDGPVTAFSSLLDNGEVVAIRRLDWAL